jgi:predicted N-formylglutamate amidohydrolase
MSACWALLISCEHGGNAVPAAYARLFDPWRELLDSHRGFDAGALTTAKALAAAVHAPLLATTTSRLVADCNRSIGHPGLFSEITKPLPARTKKALLEACYLPHREAVTAAVAELLEAGQGVLHIASHSFTPRLAGVTRRCDVGFLYDPARGAEKAFCRSWLRELAGLAPEMLLRRNYPYKGASDGLTTSLRRCFGTAYLGVELEVNQRFVQAGEAELAALNDRLVASLTRTLAQAPSCRVP